MYSGIFWGENAVGKMLLGKACLEQTHNALNTNLFNQDKRQIIFIQIVQ